VLYIFATDATTVLKTRAPQLFQLRCSTNVAELFQLSLYIHACCYADRLHTTCRCGGVEHKTDRNLDARNPVHFSVVREAHSPNSFNTSHCVLFTDITTTHYLLRDCNCSATTPIVSMYLSAQFDKH
jgi:hypothetical protein